MRLLWLHYYRSPDIKQKLQTSVTHGGRNTLSVISVKNWFGEELSNFFELLFFNVAQTR